MSTRAASFLPLRALLLLTAWACWPSDVAQAQRDLTEIPPPDPELERASFVLPEGFEVNLFAADPQIAKPIQMNFDPQGRLWIVSSSTYPQIEPGETANDKVLVIEDANRDGVAEKTTVFADGLLIPTGVAPGDDGVYIGASTELLHLEDRDEDGRADSTRVVLSGFGTEDTHHLLHTFRWGPASHLYFGQSIYIHSHIETPWGVRRLSAGGFWQFRPESKRLEVFCRGFINPWGLAFDEYGQTFATDGAGGEGINYIVPGASYRTAFQADRVLAGLNPGSPKYCGLEVVSGRHFPDDWQGNLITNDFRGHRVCRFILSDAGSGFASREAVELIRSDHVAFRPIDAKMGPDGALYIADWYNPIIQHGEVDFRDERRDLVHGRIWRVTHKDRPLVFTPNLAEASTQEVIGQLTSPEAFSREQARRILKERGREILPQLVQWYQSLDNTTENYQRTKLEVLWVHQALDVVEPFLLDSATRSSEPGVRSAAARVVAHWHDRLDKPLDILDRLVNEEHPRVRLEAVRALAAIPSPQSAAIALQATNRPMDHWLNYALELTLKQLQDEWLPAALAGGDAFSENPAHLVFALKSVDRPQVVVPLINLLASGRVPDADRAAVATLIARHGSDEQIGELLRLAGRADSPAMRNDILSALADGPARRRVRVPDDVATVIEDLLAAENPQTRAAALQLAGRFRIRPLRARLVETARDMGARRVVREAAVQGIASFADQQAREQLAELARTAESTPVRVAAIASLVPLDAAAAAQVLGEVAASLRPVDEAAGLFEAFLARKEGPGPLLQAVRREDFPADLAVVAQRAVNSSGRQFPQLADALSSKSSVTSGPKRLTADEMQALIQEVRTSGDPHAGEQVFRRKELACFDCHAIGPAGGEVGPNLVSLGATAQLDYIIESLFDPNKAVKEGYHTVVVLTDDGLVHSGIKLRESETDLILLDAKGQEIAVPLDQIEAQSPGASLMPTGVTDKLTPRETVDLIAFLAALGRDSDFTIETRNLVRTWEVLLPTEEAAHRLRRVSYAVTTTDDPAFEWERKYANVAGTLPLEDIPVVSVRDRSESTWRSAGFVRANWISNEAGTHVFRLNSPLGLQGWVDGNPIAIAETLELRLDAGPHQIVFAVDREERTSDLQLEYVDGPAITFPFAVKTPENNE